MASQDEIRHQQTLLKTYRQNLSLALRQQAIAGGGHVRPDVIHSIRETRGHIDRLKGILRGWGVRVDDHPDDEGAMNTPVDPPPAPPTSSPLLATLKDIRELLALGETADALGMLDRLIARLSQ